MRRWRAKRNRVDLIMMGWLIAVAAGGCAAREAPQPPVPPATERVRFIAVAVPPADFELTDPDSIEQRVALALVLADRGRFAEAASRFHALAVGQVNEFGDRLLLAAAVSYLQAGDREHFVATMKELRDRFGTERIAVGPAAVEVLFAIEAYYRGDQAPPPLRVLEPIMPPSRRLEEE